MAPVKRTSFVAKKFTFEQIERNGGAIQPHEGTPATRAEVMDRVCDQLLAGAGFSLNKNGGIRWRHPFDLFEHRFRAGLLPMTCSNLRS